MAGAYPNSPFPPKSTNLEKHEIVRSAFERWSEFPTAKTIGEVITLIEVECDINTNQEERYISVATPWALQRVRINPGDAPLYDEQIKGGM